MSHFSLNICEYYKYYQYQYYYNKQKNHTRIHLIMTFFMLSTVKSFDVLPNQPEKMNMTLIWSLLL